MATLPTSEPLLILPPALKRWGSPKRPGLRSHFAHNWATSDFAPRSETVGIPETDEGIPETAGVTYHFAHKWATYDSAPRSEAVGISETAGVT